MIKIWLCHDGVCDKGWSCALQWLLEKHFSSWLSNLSQAPLAPSANNRLCAGFFWTPHPLTHTLTLIILRTRNHAQYRWNCVWDNTTSWKNIYYRHAHTAVQWPHFKTINRSKWIGSVYPSAKHVLTPSNERSAGLMMPAYYLTVNTNDPLHSVSVRPPRKFHDHTHTPCLTQIDG